MSVQAPDRGGQRRIGGAGEGRRGEHPRQRGRPARTRDQDGGQAERVQHRGDQQHRGRADPVGDAAGDRAERGPGQCEDAAGHARRGVPAGGVLHQQEQGQRGHADAEPGQDADDEQDTRSGQVPDAQVLAQRGHGSHLRS